MKKTLLSFLLFPILTFAQLSSDKEMQLKNIDTYVRLIDSIADSYKEDVVEGAIVYKNVLKKKGHWKVYNLYVEPSKPSLRIKYSDTQSDSNSAIDYYYQNGAMVFATLTINYTGKKQKNQPVKKQFYFEKGTVFHETGTTDTAFGETYLLDQEKVIVKNMYK